MKNIFNLTDIIFDNNSCVSDSENNARLIAKKRFKEINNDYEKRERRKKIAESRGKNFMDIEIYIFDLMIVFRKINYDRATIGKCSIVKNLGYPTQLSVKFLNRERNLGMLHVDLYEKFYS